MNLFRIVLSCLLFGLVASGDVAQATALFIADADPFVEIIVDETWASGARDNALLVGPVYNMKKDDMDADWGIDMWERSIDRSFGTTGTGNT